MDETSELTSLRDLGKGIAVRAGLLAAGGLIVGAGVVSLAAKTASAAVKVTVGLLLITAGAGFAAYEAKKVQQRLAA